MAHLFVSSVESQNITERLQYAQQLELSGHLQEALSIYEDLYQSYPNNETVFNQLRNMYLNTRAYEKAVDLIERYQETRPDDIGLEMALAQVYFRMGEEEEARKRWDQLIERYPKQAYVYQMVANGLIEERLYDEAVGVYLSGRERIGNEDLFVFDLANLYGNMIEYGKASEELIRYLIQHPNNETLVESQVLRYPKTDRIINEILDQFEKAIDAHPTNLELRKIMVSIYRYADRYTDGLSAVRELEILTEQEKQGEALCQFGKDLFQVGETEVAEEAFLEILESYPQFQLREYVLFDLARCYEAQKRFREAIELYDKIYQEYPQSPLAPQILYQRGLLQMMEIIDLPSAAATFRFIVDRFSSGLYGDEARLALGSCMIKQGNLDEAESIYKDILDQSKEEGRLNIQALVGLADVHYLRGAFEEVLSLLDGFRPGEMGAEAMQDPVLNDGLNLRLFIRKYFPQSPDPLSLFARAEFFERQRKYDQALTLLDSLMITYPDESILADALFKTGEILIQTEAFRESLTHFNALLSRFPKSLLADQSIERMGWIYEKMGDREKALQQYEILLVDYPHSFFVDDVRQRIRKIEETR
ncbi:tetratricopeptide repeat protein [bacterium]|nr:tetratricopeptide repeat protein [bacterium]